MKKAIASIFCLLMITTSLAGCLGGDEGNSGTENVPDEPELSDWDVYHVEAGSDLPNCNSDTLGRLYYVASTTTFEVCLTSGWSFIDIQGADGAQGPAGIDGTQGPQGEKGPAGEDYDPSYINNLETEMANLNATIAQLQNNITAMEEELETVDSVIQMYYMNFIQLQNQINSLNSDLANATSCQLMPHAYCAGADLSHMNLSGMDLTGIDLRGANLQNTTFDYATLDHADLRSIVAWNATFIHAGMNNTYIENAVFNCMVCHAGANLTGAWLAGADLTSADLSGADLSDAILRNADLPGAWLGGADLSGAYLQYANLVDAYLRNADLTSAGIDHADLTDADLLYADLTDANLAYADLTKTILGGADLTNANLRFADLTNAYLGNADLSGANFEYAIVTNADFWGTTWSNTIWTDGFAYNTNQA